MRFDKVVIAEVQGHCSLKVLKLLAECVREPGKTAAMHTNRMVLLFDMACAHQFRPEPALVTQLKLG